MDKLASLLLESTDYSNNGYNLMNTVLEYYQGKTKELKKCEQYCDNIIEKFGDTTNDFKFTKKPITSDDGDVRELEKELAKMFKVNKVRIYWNSMGSVNAYTLTNSCITKAAANKNLMDGNGTNMNINIIVDTLTLTTTGITGAELLALLLHEIGHNFYFCPALAFCDVFSWITSFGILPIIQLIAKGAIILGNEFVDLIRKNVPIITNIIDTYNRWYSEISLIFKPANIILALPRVFYQQVNATSLLKYGEEKGADSFAARYGYGAELVTALKKMGVPKYSIYGEMAHKSGIGRVFADITELSMDVVSGLMLDPHPSNDQRAAALIKKLKSDLAKGEYPAEVKKELQDEIVRLEKVHNTVNIINNNPEGPKIRQSIYDMVNRATDNHSDLREIFNFYFDNQRF